MSRRGKPNRFDLPAFIAAVLCGLLIFITLNVPEPVGLANNGDFARVAYSNRLLLTDETKYERFTPRYQMNLAEGNIIRTAASVVLPDYSYYDYYTSLLFPVAFSKVINFARNLLTGALLDSYNIIWLGLVYTILFVYALYLILKFLRRRFEPGVFYFSAFAAAFVFCDQGYTLYFNSLYGEAFQFVFSFLAAGQYLSMADRERVSVFNCAVYYLVVILMAAAKNAYMPVGLLFIALPFFLGRRIAFPRKYVTLFTIVSCAILMWFTLVSTPEWIERDTNFNAVFAGVLKYSETPEQDLTELGLDPSLAVLQGWEAYMENYPLDVESEEFNAMFHDKISKFKILLFYLKHPGRLVQAMEISANHSDYIRPGYLGNKQNPTTYAEQSHKFSIWETVRTFIGFNRLWLIIAVFALGMVVCVTAAVRFGWEDAPLVALLAVIILAGGYNFIIPYIGNGICDLAKHMFGFVHLFDVLIFILVGCVVVRLCGTK